MKKYTGKNSRDKENVLSITEFAVSMRNQKGSFRMIDCNPKCHFLG